MDIPSTKMHLSPSHLSTSPVRHGSISPRSIPSSPTSVHSSSSAIFERDIETIGSPPHAQQQNPHRIPRAKTSTELSVPSVLDSAAAILTEEGGTAASDVDVELVNRQSPFTSRSPSPRHSLLLGSPAISILSSSLSSPAGKYGNSTHEEPPTPTSAYYSLQSSPATATRELPPSSPSLSAHTSSHNKRLSFVAYSDLLASTPLSTVPLASLTTEPSEPPHIMDNPGVHTPLHDEWEREGLGMGLEERLAALANEATRPNTRPSSFISSF